jgi:predicted phage terminase large subunit-like protein
MVFCPPQHGKSELVSRRLPAFMLGKNPNLKIAGASYSADLSQSFNREVQRIIQDPAYAELFPGTRLNDSNVKTSAKGSWLRNADIFEVVGSRGFYKSVGVGGPLTGTPVDIAIIDDPVKDAVEANSATYRNRVWDWYSTVLETRLHNASQVLITLTRWHEDDLAGRLLDFAKAGKGEPWVVLTLPAIKEDNSNPEDPRQIGEALWESRHSKQKILNAKSKSEKTFASLYQQRPAPEDGGMLKRDWWQFISKADFEKLARNAPRKAWIDGAYTAKQENDPSGFMATCFIQNKLYIIAAESHRLEFPEFRQKTIDFATEQGITNRGIINIEPKASGLSVIQALQRETLLPVKAFKFPKGAGISMQDDKVTRISASSSFIESGRVVLVQGNWNEAFITQCTIFPNGKHDEYIDMLAMACADSFLQKGERFITVHRD